MNAKQFLLGTLIGGAAALLLGFLIYGTLLLDFFMANRGPITGIDKENLEWWAMIVGHLGIGALLTYIYGSLANINTFSGGFRAGALIGLFMF
ncbi:MAG: hypothetical protein R3350_02775, partial [Saprospiraceae bacterium]|nr:hypothetical protein [Saprospiraceae bacterium]